MASWLEEFIFPIGASFHLGNVMALLQDNISLSRDAQGTERKNNPVLSPDIPGFRTENRTMQTRFHFHMDKCMGCHACEVACAEQNGLPVEVQWRRVGEVETGIFPDTKRLFMSSGCNHCLDAACMKGCPVDAYQVNENGIVLHLDDVCIGCQYCTWNCPYGVPVYQEDRNIVTKCDMCTHRLDEGLDPACVQACPAGAIEIETVPLTEVIETYRKDGVGPDMPDPEITMPSTKVTLPEGIELKDMTKVDRPFVEPEDPHTPLVWMTVLTQLGLGGVFAIFIVDFIHIVFNLSLVNDEILGWLGSIVIGLTGISLGASTLHLGRPAYAYRAMKNWRTSWLSREVLGLSLFAGVAMGYAFFSIFTEGLDILSVEVGGGAVRLLLGWISMIAGLAGVYCSSMIYRVPARPGWDSVKTTADFFCVAFILGPAAFSLSVVISDFIWDTHGFYLTESAKVAAAIAGLMLIFNAGLQGKFVQLWRESEVHELRACAHLYLVRFLPLRVLRNIVGAIGLTALIAIVSGATALGSGASVIISGLALVSLLVFCLMQRYLFFVTVVPKNIPGNFHMAAQQAKG